MRTMIGVLALALGAPLAGAETDQLQCFKITNQTLKKLKGIVDLDAPGFDLAPGCKLKKARLYCVPAAASVQSGTLFDGRLPVTPLGYVGPPAEAPRICYDVSCPAPAGTAAAATASDHFGVHEFTKLKTGMLCTSALVGVIPPTGQGFQIVTPEVEIQPLQEIAYCYYFRTPNAVTLAVNRWTSTMGPANHHAIVYLTNGDKQPPGTLSAASCGIAGTPPGAPQLSKWVYDAYTPSAELVLPADDGSGTPVAMEIPANTAGFVYMFHQNLTEDVVKARVTVTAGALALGAAFTRTGTYLAYNSVIDIPPGAVGDVEAQACDVPATAKFWRMTMHAHKQAAQFSVLDGPTPVFTGSDWNHPGATTWTAPSFFTFTAGGTTSDTRRLSYSCVYNNPTNRTIRTGDSASTDEECIAVGYFFPAPSSLLCLNSLTPPAQYPF